VKSYATYIKGEARESAANGLLSVEPEGIRFESFPKQTAIEALFPTAAREPDPKINWFYPREEIRALTDLQGRKTEPPGLAGRILRALQVEPNGLIIATDRARVVFDCAISVYRIIAAYDQTTR
jgi:hypothetical protein